MKKLLSITLALILTASFLSACGAAADTAVPTATPAVSATAAPSPSPVPTVEATPSVTAAPAIPETVFTKDISKEEKEQAVDLIYTTVKKNFAAWDDTFTFEDWKSAYPDVMECVLATNNLYDFYMELKRFVALLNDDHSYVISPDSFNDDIWFTPVRFEYINDGYYIVSGEGRELQKLPQFSKIIKIDNIPIDDYMAQNAFPYIGTANKSTAVYRFGSGMVRTGQANTSQTFEVITPDGEITTATIERMPYSQPYENKIDSPTLSIDAEQETLFTSDLLTVKRLNNDFIYVNIATFENGDVVRQFEAWLDTLKQAKGIILDVRGNGGGDSANAKSIARHFITGAYPDVQVKTTNYNARTDTYTLVSQGLPNLQGIGDITAPVVVLQSYLTGSAAEHFLDFMSYAQNAVSIGTESAGGTGDSTMADLPGGGLLRVTNNKITRGDGTEFLDVGIQPDIYMATTIEDYENSHDAVLDYALDYLAQK